MGVGWGGWGDTELRGSQDRRAEGSPWIPEMLQPCPQITGPVWEGGHPRACRESKTTQGHPELSKTSAAFSAPVLSYVKLQFFPEAVTCSAQTFTKLPGAHTSFCHSNHCIDLVTQGVN